MNIAPTQEALRVMATIRPPSAKPARLVQGYKIDVPINPGVTLELEVGERVIAPGSGSITSITRRLGAFVHSTGALDYSITYEVVIDHGCGLVSTLKGLASVDATGGYIARGGAVGSPLTQEIFFGVTYNGKSFDPHSLNRSFQLQGVYVLAQAGKMRFSPDMRVRDFAGSIYSTLQHGLRYFIDKVTGFSSLLVNIDFNGDGSKVGPAAVGLDPLDYWNVFAAGAFTWAYASSGCCGYAYGYGYGYGYGCGVPARTFNTSPQTKLLDSRGKTSPVWLERVDIASGAAGTLAAWDELISSWIGGWSGAVPEENFFAIRGLVSGTYDIFLYANTFGRLPATATAFYASVNNGMPVLKTTSSTALPQWIENANYVKFSLTVPVSGVVYIKAYGYFDGLQIKRNT